MSTPSTPSARKRKINILPTSSPTPTTKRSRPLRIIPDASHHGDEQTDNGQTASPADSYRPTKSSRYLFISRPDGVIYAFRTPRAGRGETLTPANLQWHKEGVIDEEQYLKEVNDRIRHRHGRWGKLKAGGSKGNAAGKEDPLTAEQGRKREESFWSEEADKIVDLTVDDEANEDDEERTMGTTAVNDEMEVDHPKTQSSPKTANGDGVRHDDNVLGAASIVDARDQECTRVQWTANEERALWLAQLKYGEGLNWLEVMREVSIESKDLRQRKSLQECQRKWAQMRQAAFGAE